MVRPIHRFIPVAAAVALILGAVSTRAKTADSPLGDLLGAPEIDTGIAAPAAPDRPSSATKRTGALDIPGGLETTPAIVPTERRYPRLNGMSLSSTLISSIPIHRYPETRKKVRDAIEVSNVQAMIAALREAIDRDPDYVPTRAVLAVVLDRYRRAYDEAAQLLDEAVRTDPDNDVVQAALAEHYLLTGDLRKCKEICNKAIEKNPDSPPLWAEELSVHYLVRVGKAEEAIPQIDKLLSRDPDNLIGILTLGNMSRMLGNPEPIITRYEAVVRRTRDPIARNNLAYLYLMTGRLKPAYETVLPLVKEYPDSIPAADTLAMVLLRSGNAEKALELFDDILNRAPNFTPAILHKALALSQLGRVDEAKDDLRRALMLNNGDLEESEIREARRRIPLGP